jgi:hypothetical protein
VELQEAVKCKKLCFALMELCKAYNAGGTDAGFSECLTSMQSFLRMAPTTTLKLPQFMVSAKFDQELANSHADKFWTAMRLEYVMEMSGCSDAEALVMQGKFVQQKIILCTKATRDQAWDWLKDGVCFFVLDDVPF